jgi:cobalamin synthase
MTSTYDALRAWSRRRWLAAFAGTVLGIVVVAVPTDLLDTPLFSREVPPTWWSWPALLLSAVLAGLLMATYVREPAPGEHGAEPGSADEDRRPRMWGGAGGLLTFFAVGCPVCNKLVLLALGASGAMTYFEPVQPVLSLLALALLAWALTRRLRNQLACPVPASPSSGTA